MNTNSSNQNTVDITNNSESTRLPCRGCSRNCSDYKYCNGKPWRMENRKDSNKDLK